MSSTDKKADKKADAARGKRTPDDAGKEDALGQALEDSFPASDPPSMTQPGTKAGAPRGKHS